MKKWLLDLVKSLPAGIMTYGIWYFMDHFFLEAHPSQEYWRYFVASWIGGWVVLHWYTSHKTPKTESPVAHRSAA